MASGKVLQALVEISGTISPTLSKSIEEATGKLGGINVKALAVGAAAGGIALATGKAVIEAGKYLVDLGGKFDGATDAIRIGTGATGEALEALNADFDAVYKSVPTTMEDASKAIADYNTRLGLSGEPLQEISKQALQVSNMLGDDLGGVIEGSSQAFQAWNIDASKMGDAMDFVFKASQSTGIGFTELMQKTQQFAPQLQAMGYGFEDATALVGQLEKAGANTDEVLAAMKKSVGTLAKEGYSASEGLQLYYEKIKNAGSAAKATTIANEIFGARAGSTVASAIRDGTLAVDDFTASLQANGESIMGAAEDTMDFPERLQMFKQQAEVALKPLANTMFDALNDLMPIVADAMESLSPIIEETVTLLAPLITELFEGLMPALKEILPIVVNIGGKLLTTLLPPIMKLFNAVMPIVLQLLEAIMPILDIIIELLDPILNLILQVLQPVLDLISQAIAPLIRVLSELINAVLQPLGPIIEWLSGLFTEILGAAIDNIRPIIDSSINVFRGVIDFVKNVFSGNWSGAWQAIVDTFGSIWDTIKAVFKAPINGVIRMLNWFIGKINSISVTLPDWGILGEYAGYTVGFNISEIPLLAEGGFTKGISIAGEAGTEAVISFDPSVRGKNIDIWEQAGQMLGVDPSYTAQAGKLLSLDDFSLSELSGSASYVIYYDFSNFKWSPTFASSEDDDDLMTRLKEHEAEFFDWLEEFVRMREVGCFA
jgi:TP901 family phage tail tape measure protein